MNFFTSVFSDDLDPSHAPEPQSHASNEGRRRESEEQQHPVISPDSNPNSSSTPNSSISAGVWSFGGLIKNIASRSESVIQTYRRDLEEFGSGLKKETAVIREVASRAVKDLPASLEAGASVAQESLESVGQAIDNLSTTVWKETTDIISHGKESLLVVDHDDSEYDSDNTNNYSGNGNQRFSESRLKPYSRFDSQLRAIQCEEKTYCVEPDDLDEFRKWKMGFSVEAYSEEIGSLIRENGAVEGVYMKLVPGIVDNESFWRRYFYRVHKLKQTEDARAKLVKRAVSGEEEEELTWDFDDEDQDNNGLGTRSDMRNEDFGDVATECTNVVGLGMVTAETGGNRPTREYADTGDAIGTKEGDGICDEVGMEGKLGIDEIKSSKVEEVKSDDKLGLEGKGENNESCKDSDVSVVSTQPSMPEVEDLGWDEIEDLGSNDENNKVVITGSPGVDLHKRLSAAEEEEDLSWDIEDDDEPVKS